MGNLVMLILEFGEGIQHFFAVNEISDTKGWLLIYVVQSQSRAETFY